jgi:hypothetical protein
MLIELLVVANNPMRIIRAIETASVTSCITRFVLSAKRQERLVVSVGPTKVNAYMVFLEPFRKV